MNQFRSVLGNVFFKYVCNCSMPNVACSDSSSATSADDSDAETIDAMESSIPDPDVTLDDDLSAASKQDPFPPSGDDSKITLR